MYINKVISNAGAWEKLTTTHIDDYFRLVEFITDIHYRTFIDYANELVDKALLDEETKGSKSLFHYYPPYLGKDFIENCWNDIEKRFLTIHEVGKNRNLKNRWLHGDMFKDIGIKLFCTEPMEIDLWLSYYARKIVLEREADLTIGIMIDEDSYKDLIYLGSEIRGEAEIDLDYDYVDFSDSYKAINELRVKTVKTPFIIIEIGFNSRRTMTFTVEELLAEKRIERTIEFPAQYKQAGIGILNYFSNILEEKYPDIDISVKIIQKDKSVQLVVESPNGDKETIEKTFDEYGAVVMGYKPIEELGLSPEATIELRSELRIAHSRIETQNELLALKDSRYDDLKELFELHIFNQPKTINIENSPVINVTQSNEQSITLDFSNLLAGLSELSTAIQGDALSEPYIQQLLREIDELKKANASKEDVKQSDVVGKINAILKGADTAGKHISSILEKTEKGQKALANLAKVIAPFLQ